MTFEDIEKYKNKASELKENKNENGDEKNVEDKVNDVKQNTEAEVEKNEDL